MIVITDAGDLVIWFIATVVMVVVVLGGGVALSLHAVTPAREDTKD